MMKNMTATTEPKDKPIEELKALRERVAGLTKADEETDARILCALGAPPGSKVEQSHINGAWCIYEPRQYGREPFALWENHGWFRVGGWNVTASIDAALALVEKRGLDPQLILEMALERVALENYRRDEFVFFIARAVIVETIAAELYSDPRLAEEE